MTTKTLMRKLELPYHGESVGMATLRAIDEWLEELERHLAEVARQRRAATVAALQRLALAASWNGLFVVGATTWAMSYAQQAFPAALAHGRAQEEV